MMSSSGISGIQTNHAQLNISTIPIEPTFRSALYSTLAKLFIPMPLISSIAMVGFYFLSVTLGWWVIIWGVLVTFFLWLIVSLIWTGFWIWSVYPKTKNKSPSRGSKRENIASNDSTHDQSTKGSGHPQVGGYPKAIPNMIFRLWCRIEQIENHLNVLHSLINSCELSKDDGETVKKLVYSRTQSYVMDAKKILLKTKLGPLWVVGHDELAAIAFIHRAEESLYLIDPHDIVIDRGIADYLLLKDSKVRNQEYFLKLIKSGLECIDPLAINYLAVAEPEEQLKQLQKGLSTDNRKHAFRISSEKIESGHSRRETMARIVLSKVRRFSNEYRDRRGESIVHLRDQLVRGLVAAGIVTFILVSLVISTLYRLTATISLNMMFLSGVTFYIIGAMAGLFGRFFGEVDREGLHADYDLSLARLIATPLFSGLAGVVGVVIALSLGGVLGGQQSLTNTFAEIFQFKPLNLLIAAAFGLTPNLVMQKLKIETKQSDEDEKTLQFRSELQSLAAGARI